MRGYLIIATILIFSACAYPECRHNVIGDALFIGERFEIYQIAVDPSIAKHAQVRYFDGKTWLWYCETLPYWTPEHFTPVLFFTAEEYLEWYKGIYHNITAEE